MTKKVLIIDGGAHYRDMFLEAGFELTLNIVDADLLQFTGGADVSPFLYGEQKHPTTHNDSRRDLVEAGYFAWGKRLGKPMAGICRGGQFLNVMNGGKMFQDVDGHAIHGTHEVYDRFTQKTHQVTSTHHQMMIPAFHKGAELIAVADESSRLTSMEDGVSTDHIPPLGMDTEVVYYNGTKCLCFQPHPEFPAAYSTREYYFELLNRYLGV